MKQHYVPKCYLKNFGEFKDDNYFVEVYDQQINRHFSTNIKTICSRVNFYTLDPKNELSNDIYLIEKLYSNGIEPLYMKAYEILNNHKISKITDEQRFEILLSIFQFHIRNPEFLKRRISEHSTTISNLYQQAISNGRKGLTFLNEDFSFKEFSLEAIIEHFTQKLTKRYKEKHINGIFEIRQFHEYAKFEILVARENDSEFITSDNPLIVRDLFHDNPNPLLKSKEFLIAINKKVALRIFHDNRKELNQITRLAYPCISVATVNKSIIEQSSRFLISNKRIIDAQKDHEKKFLNNDSLEMKIDFFRQLIRLFKDSKIPSQVEGLKPIIHFINIYEKQGKKMSDEQQYNLYLPIRHQSKDLIEQIIK